MQWLPAANPADFSGQTCSDQLVLIYRRVAQVG